MSFNFSDFLIFTSNKDMNEASYATIAHGVLGTVQGVYKIQLDNKPTHSFTQKLTALTGLTLYTGPVNSVSTITQGGVDVPFTQYEREVVFTNTLTSLVQPVVITGDFGYTDVPLDLKLAIYRHIESVYFSINNHTDDVAKVTNTTGNTVVYSSNVIPEACRVVYDFYSPRQMIL